MLFSVLSITDAIRINFWIQYKILFNVDLRNTLHSLICILNIEIHPDPRPLIITICRVSFSDRLLVQLFSNPQQTQARMTNV